MPKQTWLLVAAVAAYVLVATREAAPHTTMKPWFEEITHATLYNPSPLSSVSSPNSITDYFFFTWLMTTRKHVRYLCALKRCVAIHPTDNILVCIALHVAAYLYAHFRPYESFQYFYVNGRRPYTYVLAQLSMPNLYGLVCAVMMLADFGESVIKQHTSSSMHLFWVLYVGIPVIAVLVMQQFGGEYVQMGGGRAGLLALAAFASQTVSSKQRFLFLGHIPVNAYGLVGIEAMWILIEHFTLARFVECAIIITLGVVIANL